MTLLESWAGAALGAQTLQTDGYWGLWGGVTPESPEVARCPLSCDEMSLSDNGSFIICLLCYTGGTKIVWKCYPDKLNETKRGLQIH